MGACLVGSVQIPERFLRVLTATEQVAPNDITSELPTKRRAGRVVITPSEVS